MTDEPAPHPSRDLRVVMRGALKDAMKGRDRLAASALRSALAAVDNAEAVPTEPGPTAGAGDSPIAGAVVGLGATEAARRELTADDVYSLVRAEIGERHAAADAVDAAGRPDRAADLRREADVLEAVLAGGSPG
ncbi:hypothetical protein [Knoellia sp. LjRoot47]|uniref:hypothetical protein n=1 Tax=Knoellia sp. LjRoot47 TaxID=3342330 RepID=UPI003ECCD480